MAEPILMTALSPTMTEGTIAQWLAKEGQALKSGDALCEVETDKATMTYESPASGTLLKILLGPGSGAAVGQIIGVIGKPGESWEEIAAKAKAPAGQSAPAPAPAKKPAAPAPAPAAPAAAPKPASAPLQSSAFSPPPSPTLAPGVPRSSPVARKMAQEKGLDLRLVKGTGPGGRIVARDVEQYQAAPVPAPAARAAAPAAKPAGGAKAAVASAKGLRGDRVPLSKMRSIIASRLHQSYSQAPHYFVRIAIEMDRLFALRKKLNEGRDPALSLNAFILKLVAAALERHPALNVSWEGDAIQYLPNADIGLAVALDGGLITPVVRACEAKGLEAIDQELGGLIAKARSGALVPEEYTGASFTISNLGSFGVEEFTAIINPPGSAILALGAVAEEAVVRDGAIVPRRILHATLSSDHRAIDGAQAAAFLAEFKALCEEPARALL